MYYLCVIFFFSIYYFCGQLAEETSMYLLYLNTSKPLSWQMPNNRGA